ncbi:MAG: 50S ribosomal protein L24, partial [Candidatus Altiarchaeales archaeon]|nr:50S ribosomal protein L24 [Candidatus Altiarchaeales archaeon]
LFNAPLHKKKAFCRAMLSKELKKTYGLNSMQVRKGDTVKVMRGELKGSTGNVIRVEVDKRKVYVDGLTMKKADGTDIERPLEPSNLQITMLDLEDKKRKKILERKAGV